MHSGLERGWEQHSKKKNTHTQSQALTLAGRAEKTSERVRRVHYHHHYPTTDDQTQQPAPFTNSITLHKTTHAHSENWTDQRGARSVAIFHLKATPKNNSFLYLLRFVPLRNSALATCITTGENQHLRNLKLASFASYKKQDKLWSSGVYKLSTELGKGDNRQRNGDCSILYSQLGTGRHSCISTLEWIKLELDCHLKMVGWLDQTSKADMSGIGVLIYLGFRCLIFIVVHHLPPGWTLDTSVEKIWKW